MLPDQNFLFRNTWLDEYHGEFLPIERGDELTPYAFQVRHISIFKINRQIFRKH